MGHACCKNSQEQEQLHEVEPKPIRKIQRSKYHYRPKRQNCLSPPKYDISEITEDIDVSIFQEDHLKQLIEQRTAKFPTLKTEEEWKLKKHQLQAQSRKYRQGVVVKSMDNDAQDKRHRIEEKQQQKQKQQQNRLKKKKKSFSTPRSILKKKEESKFVLFKSKTHCFIELLSQQSQQQHLKSQKKVRFNMKTRKSIKTLS